MPTPRKDPKFGSLIMVTYGLVTIMTAVAIGGYYYMSSHMQNPGVSLDQTGHDRLVQVGAVWVAQYPGALLAKGNIRTEEIPDGELTEGEMAFRTSDHPDKVLAYYRDKLGAVGYQVSEAAENEKGGSVQAVRMGGRTRVQVVVDSEDQPDGSVATIGTLRTFSKGEIEISP